ncbi:MAG: hypothetical protein LQ342_002117 [Letrouitia transgressa]|nr:MAG: hypothetical protein LQ342_002117 [Letrouitia transgressa]
MASNEERARLKAHFSVPVSNHPDRWSKLWDAGDFLPWDRGLPNPALVDTLTQRQHLVGTCFVDEDTGRKQRKQALVPGCGRGYDVLLLASLGYNAYGLEISDAAINKCLEEQKANAHKYPVHEQAEGGGTAEFVKGDFFSDKWLEILQEKKTFDLIYDYTFLCALPPSMRPAWAHRMSQLLSAKPSGQLICLEFPTYKEPSTGGPPFGVTPNTYLEHLSHPGIELPYNDAGQVVEGARPQPSTGGLERTAHWQPEKTHEIGKGTDWVSIWRHDQSLDLL